MKTRIGKWSILALALSACLPAHAQPKYTVQPRATEAQALDMTDGEVRKIDREARKITLRHGEIRNLEMPPMTMAFQVKDAAMLDSVKTGDKVRFRVEKLGGAYTLTAIEPVR